MLNCDDGKLRCQERLFKLFVNPSPMAERPILNDATTALKAMLDYAFKCESDKQGDINAVYEYAKEFLQLYPEFDAIKADANILRKSTKQPSMIRGEYLSHTL